MVKRLFVRKIASLDVEGPSLHRQIREFLQIDTVENVLVYNGYDIEGLADEAFEMAVASVFSEPNADEVSTCISIGQSEVGILYKLLPGQYDQRADSAKQCLDILGLGEGVTLQTFKAVILTGGMAKAELDRIKAYLINPVEAVEIGLEAPKSTAVILPVPSKVKVYQGFREMDELGLQVFIKTEGLAMSLADLKTVQIYFNNEKRDPSHTELKVLDTYWSDHCRHTTFTTTLSAVNFEETDAIAYKTLLASAQARYHEMRDFVYGEKAKTRPITLMDLATINAKYENKKGNLSDVLESEEINAATFETEVTFEDGSKAPYWVLFKNETHNHPTEIEPFGGAATCLGGAIRDPLSGRALVYQGMRITGSADPRAGLEETLSGKLPQRVITKGAARGFSSYGNQIGLATGFVREYYHEGFLAKRMEVGAVVGAVPRDQVRRETPVKGDVVLLIGGKTGIDGCGGATGSSKEHDEASLATCASEVQRGNAPEERKLQRLFSNETFASLVKKSNDFGAGGVSVAVGELADSLDIDLDAVKTKYEGLDGTQLAISESQERMAVVVEAKDVATVIALANQENLEAYTVAKVTDDGYLRMCWRGEEILCLSRDFIETHGAKRSQEVFVQTKEPQFAETVAQKVTKESLMALMGDLNYASQEGLVEMFDNSIGALSVHMPYGGRYQKTPAQAMVSKIPGYGKAVKTATVMAAGYKPNVLEKDPFVGGIYSTLEALAKVVAVGGRYEKVKFSMQEYFEKLGEDPVKWSKPYKALLGSAYVMNGLGLAAIGGKDSMSGTFKEISVPPTLIAFAATVAESEEVVSAEFKSPNEDIYCLDFPRDLYGIPELERVKKAYQDYETLVKLGVVTAACALEEGGIVGALVKMSYGNQIGFEMTHEDVAKNPYSAKVGAILMSIKPKAELSEVQAQALRAVLEQKEVELLKIGKTHKDYIAVIAGESFDLAVLQSAWELPLEEVFPRVKDTSVLACGHLEKTVLEGAPYIHKGLKPKVFIPSFPGTNCELDTKNAFELAGAQTQVIVFRNKTPKDIEESLVAFTKAASEAKIIALPGGFSAGDEPDGSGKFICSVFKNPKLAEEVMHMLKVRDGLMIGICNGFQALVKLGLVTYGDIRNLEEDAPTLTYNTCGKHISKIVSVEAVDKRSPWLNEIELGTSYQVPLSHGEGRFFCNEAWYGRLKANRQLATTYQEGSNLNGSMFGIEGIVSPDGRVFGKMGHAERIGTNVYKNVPGRYETGIFRAGVNYFK